MSVGPKRVAAHRLTGQAVIQPFSRDSRAAGAPGTGSGRRCPGPPIIRGTTSRSVAGARILSSPASPGLCCRRCKSRGPGLPRSTRLRYLRRRWPAPRVTTIACSFPCTSTGTSFSCWMVPSGRCRRGRSGGFASALPVQGRREPAAVERQTLVLPNASSEAWSRSPGS